MGSNETGVKQQNNWVHFLDSFCLFRKKENTDSQQIIPMFVFFLTWISNACSVKSDLSCFAEWLTTANACKKKTLSNLLLFTDKRWFHGFDVGI